MPEVKTQITQIAQYTVDNLEAQLFPNSTTISRYETLQISEGKYQSGLMKAAEKYLKLGSFIDRVAKRLVNYDDMETFARYKSGMHDGINSGEALDFLISGGQDGVHFRRGLDYLVLVSDDDPSDRRIVRMADVSYKPALWSRVAAGVGAALVAGIGGFAAASNGYIVYGQNTDTPQQIPDCAVKPTIDATMGPGEWGNPAQVLKFTASTQNSDAMFCKYEGDLYYLVRDFADNRDHIQTDITHAMNLFIDRKGDGGTAPQKDDFVICYHIFSASHDGTGERNTALTYGDGTKWIDIIPPKIYDHKIPLNTWEFGFYTAQNAGEKSGVIWEGKVPINGGSGVPSLVHPDNTSGIFGLRVEVGYAEKCCRILERSSPTDQNDNEGNQMIPDSFRKVFFGQPEVCVSTTVTTTATSTEKYTEVRETTKTEKVPFPEVHKETDYTLTGIAAAVSAIVAGFGAYALGRRGKKRAAK
ncbi:MAG TPA: hypothetical protein VJJ76_00315 [archaeon]|nr:hypothetical protein [archaeon]